jgi:hypothetical protein
MNDLALRMLLRSTLCFKNIGLFETSSGQGLYGDAYSGNHVAIFECPLKAPPQLSFVDHSLDAINDSYKINFKHWKIVDIDNYMEGNHFFSTLTLEDTWNHKVRNLLNGPALTYKEQEAQSPHFFREVLVPELREFQMRIDSLDTKSNRKMHLLRPKLETKPEPSI